MSALEDGAKVELEWLQIRVELDTPVDEDRYRIVEQCQKLVQLDAAAEAALLKQFPQPQIMIRKESAAGPGKQQRTEPPSAAAAAAGGGEGKQEANKNKSGGKKGKKKGKKGRGK